MAAPAPSPSGELVAALLAPSPEDSGVAAGGVVVVSGASPPAANQIPESIVATVALVVGVYFVLLSVLIGCIIWMSLKRLRAKCVPEEAADPHERGLQSGVIKFSQAQILEGTKRYNSLVKKETFSSSYKLSRPGLPLLMARRIYLPAHPRRKSGEFGDVVARMAQISSHPNLVKVAGFSATGMERVLVYEWLPNGTLTDLLHVQGAQLTWRQRMEVALAVARGLHHLHGLTPPCPHGFLDSSHVLLTDKLEAKICCAGWSLLLLPELGLHQGMAHAVQQKGFSAPEQVVAGQAQSIPITPSSDVYAFGVLLLELFSGRKALDPSRGPQEALLADFLRPILLHKDDTLAYMDPFLQGDISLPSVLVLADLARKCIAIDPARRPAISTVVAGMLKALHGPHTSAGGRSFSTGRVHALRLEDVDDAMP